MIALGSAILTAFVLTIFIELTVARFMGTRNRRDLLSIILVNLVTHPPFSWFFVFGRGMVEGRQAMFAYLFLLEVLVTLVEWGILRAVLSNKAPAAWKLSLGMNLVSGSIGALRL